MDFSTIFQLRTKKFWWMDVIFYFVISLLVATLLIWLIFLVKNNMQNADMQKENNALLAVGTQSQQAQEKEVINYRGKINDFSNLLKNHEFASNVFAFMQTQTMPNVWFKQFSLDKNNSAVQLSGEADGMDAFSRQVAILEKNKYVKDIGNLNSSLGAAARIEFNMSLALNQNIFSYLSDTTLALLNPAPTDQSLSTNAVSAVNGQQPTGGTLSSEKLITSFHLLLTPEVAGQVDETNYAVVLNVPYGTDVKNLKPSIVISPEATVSPAAGVLQDFTSPVAYVVTAQDGSTQNYQVKVIVAAQPITAKKPSQFSIGIIITIILSILVVVAIAVGVFFLYKKKLKTKI